MNKILNYFGFDKKSKSYFTGSEHIIFHCVTAIFIAIALTTVSLASIVTYRLILENHSPSANETITHVSSSGEEKFYIPKSLHPNSESVLIHENNKSGKIEVESGVKIYISKNGLQGILSGQYTSCTLTVINGSYGLTAGHCAHDMSINKELYIKVNNNGDSSYLKLGNSIEYYNSNNPKVIGEVDVMVIKFKDYIQGKTLGFKYDEKIDNGDNVTTYGATSGAQFGKIDDTGIYPKLKHIFGDIKVMFISNTSRKGDSGGAVYNSSGEVIGIISFITPSGETGVVSNSEILRHTDSLKDILR